jgi:lipopolysaccharide transport system ATP-binding protein
MKPILEIQNVSKQYTLGGKRIRKTENFRELLQRALSSPLRAMIGRNRVEAAKEELYTFWALKDVSIDVHQGDVIGIIGRNGSRDAVRARRST